MDQVPLIFLIGVIYFCPNAYLCWRLLASAHAWLGMVIRRQPLQGCCELATQNLELRPYRLARPDSDGQET